MKTKAEIVQNLLNESKITAEEAVILLTSEKDKEYIFVPAQPYPVYPYQPFQPFYNDTFKVNCTINGEKIPVILTTSYQA